MDLESVVAQLQHAPAWLIYLAVFLSALIENLFPPYPGDAVIVFAGFVSAGGESSSALCLLFALAGNLLGGAMMFWGGGRVLDLAHRVNAWVGRPRWLHNLLENLSSAQRMEKAKASLDRFGLWLVLVSRFLAGVRYFVSIVAGLGGMNPVAFFLSFAAGVLIWNALLLYAGWQLGAAWRLALEWIRLYSVAVFSVLGVGLLAFVAWRILHWRRERFR